MPVARRLASLTRTRGPSPTLPASLSGSAATTLRIWNVALPMLMRSPSLRSSRASRVESTAAPNAPSRSASRSAIGILGSSVTCAEHRIVAVHGLEFDQRQLAVAAAGHDPQRGRDRNLAARAQEGEFLRLGFALDQRERNVAAEQRAALARQTFAEAGRDRADAGNRHHAERDAGDEDVKAAQAAAQFAQRVAQGKR